jgi:hypothetical protein
VASLQNRKGWGGVLYQLSQKGIIMTTQKSKRVPSGAPATKWFITAASVAAMLGGWVAFSSQPATNEADIATQILATNLRLEPIPTLVPAPTGRQKAILTSDTAGNAQTSLPTLRSVSAPQPRPITVTRSSH